MCLPPKKSHQFEACSDGIYVFGIMTMTGKQFFCIYDDFSEERLSYPIGPTKINIRTGSKKVMLFPKVMTVIFLHKTKMFNTIYQKMMNSVDR